jgi:flagellar motility protein MotE (MotC chaperone)
MIRNKKLTFFLVACLLFSGLSVGYKDGYILKVLAGTAFAEDKEEKNATDQVGAKGEGGGTPCPECPECPDSAKLVLRGLEDKKNQIAKSQTELDQEKKELERYEEQIDEKLAALAALKEQINGDMALLEEKKTQKEREAEAAYEAKIGRLVKMYAGMKPKNAALIVDKMTLDVAQEIFLRMREASASQILAFVDSEKAAKISERLAFKKNQ